MNLSWGTHSLLLEIADDQRVTHHRGPAALADLYAATLAALETPVGFPPLRQAITPEDHIAIVLGDDLQGIDPLLQALRETLQTAGVAPEAITVLHNHSYNPEDRSELAYLATTKAGQRVYLARPIVEADQVVVVSARRYGQVGAEATLFPGYSDGPTRGQTVDHDTAREVAWLLGLPFHVQAIDAASGGYAEILAGSEQAARAGEQHRDAAWRVRVPRRPDTVIVTTSPTGVVAAVDNAARVVQPNGRIAVLVDGMPVFPDAFDAIRQTSDPAELVSDHPEVLAWIAAVGHARVSLWSDLEATAAEELFATALQGPEQVQRLVARSGDCLILEDGHRSLAVVE
jgi:hypothetical protein